LNEIISTDSFQLALANESAQLNQYLLFQRFFKNELTELHWLLLGYIKVEST